ncbi:hypothetical protein J2T13_004949 [Paenibacillus sp. DS2015]|uniref:hypothetical protein n=1 Tax=Paenibacillus sp. DS2015 TaxID=3373917 RepID=UPI003D1C67CC
MPYATIDDYDQYGDGLIPWVDLERALSRASDQIDSLTYNRIMARWVDNLTPFQRTNVIKAVCRQADFMYQYGDYLTMPLAGYSAGSISLSFKAVQGAGGIQTSESVSNLLTATGLTSRRL